MTGHHEAIEQRKQQKEQKKSAVDISIGNGWMNAILNLFVLDNSKKIQIYALL